MRIDQNEFGCTIELDGEVEAILQTSTGHGWAGIGFTDVQLGGHGKVSIVQQGIHFALSLGPSSQRFRWSGQTYHFAEDNITILEPGATVFEDWTGPFRTLTLRLAPEAVERITDVSLARTRVRTQFVPSRSQIAVGHLLQAVSADLATGCSSGPLLVESVSATLLQLFSSAEASPRRGGPTLTSSQATILRDLILGHLTEPLSLQQLADAIGTSIGHLVRAFRTSFGVTPYQFILRERVNLAQELIATGTMSLNEIVPLAGFSDASQMSKTFRRLTGQPPRAFVRLARGIGSSGPSTGRTMAR
ncbi:helix-turn-helix domain-containing protein [Methylobacterium marchantiae]|uniref:Helix-turn-helix domain-containing protein n=1 Tax=Methylobacterium marchantiae TaxID=600331 RepID=A0ABW3WTU4_9HYPH|nr:HTH-type transcriptional activator RhaS [Methylobacterium marchantiae]